MMPSRYLISSEFLQMYALTHYACYKAISSVPLSGDMLPSTLMLKMFALLPSLHHTCFFFCGAVLKHMPAGVRSHLMHDRTLDPLSFALRVDEIYQNRVSSASTLNHISSTPKECLFLFCSWPFVPLPPPVPVPGPSNLQPLVSPLSLSVPNLPHRNHADQAQK